jgi:hypothetical protein
MTLQRFTRRTKHLALVVLLPIPYGLLASAVCIVWHSTLPKKATGGAWFDFCMPDGILFNFVFVLLVLVSAVSFIPLLVFAGKDWLSGSAVKASGSSPRP